MSFGATSTTEEVLAGVELTGVTALVTGASTGLGLETARALAAHGARVIATARTPEKAETTLATLRSLVPDGEVECGVVALDSLASVRTFAAWVRERTDRLELLINNAGIMATPFARTVDGFESQFGTNHLAHFVLTNELLPLLVAGKPSRIVNLSSGGHVSSDVLWDDPNFEHTEYDPWVSYGQSKSANILFTVELQRRFGAGGIDAFAVHPGRVSTELGRYMTRETVKALFARAAAAPSSGSGGGMPEARTIENGASTSVWAATAPELAGRGGVYLADCSIAEPLARTLDPDAAARLWELSERLVGASS
jgi:NAD(P)-dependent dehydrogenase (short-subunit alcohol dehydrogenase family)